MTVHSMCIKNRYFLIHTQCSETDLFMFTPQVSVIKVSSVDIRVRIIPEMIWGYNHYIILHLQVWLGC